MHTPAPWAAAGTPTTFDIRAGEKLIGSFSWHDASPHYPNEPESRANAHLMAAAPELLAAARDMARMLEAVRYTVGLGPKQMARIDAAKAAVAKAEGRS